MMKSVCKERFYYNFSHFSHFRDGFSFCSLPTLDSVPRLRTKRHFKHHFHEDVQKLNIFVHTELSALSFASSPYTFATEKRKNVQKGDLLDVYIVMFMLMMPF